jgi:hypothetical protein
LDAASFVTHRSYAYARGVSPDQAGNLAADAEALSLYEQAFNAYGASIGCRMDPAPAIFADLGARRDLARTAELLNASVSYM